LGGDIFVAHLEGLSDAAHGVGEFQAEQGHDHDVQGELAHLAGHVNTGAGLPPAFVAAGEVGHDLSVARDATVVELGLHQATLAQVQWAVGGHQTVAEEVAHG
jgi:hypothetical protein